MCISVLPNFHTGNTVVNEELAYAKEAEYIPVSTFVAVTCVAAAVGKSPPRGNAKALPVGTEAPDAPPAN